MSRQRSDLARAFIHSTMKEACKRTNSNPFPSANPIHVRHLKRIAYIFVRLQQQRETADYDSSIRWSRTEALTLIDMVQEAFEVWSAIREQEIAEDFLLERLVQKRRGS